jgi:hypothetical protein
MASSSRTGVDEQSVNDANALADVGRESTADTFMHGIDRKGVNALKRIIKGKSRNRI